MSKKIITICLIVFVAASVAGLAVKEYLASQKQAALETQDPAELILKQLAPEGGDKIVVMYVFFGKRCATCHKIETYTKMATVDGEYNSPAAVVWKPINADLPENALFKKHYKLPTKAVILQRIENGKLTNSKNLDRIWELASDQPAFIDYIQNETIHFINREPN